MKWITNFGHTFRHCFLEIYCGLTFINCDRFAFEVEPQKGVPWEREGVGLKILSAGRDGIPAKKMHSRKIAATPAL
jgi:hypothetical protein